MDERWKLRILVDILAIAWIKEKNILTLSFSNTYDDRTNSEGRLYLERKLYGSPKMTKILQQERTKILQKNSCSLDAWIWSSFENEEKYKATISSKHTLPLYPNLLGQQFEIEQPNQGWIDDITYIWTKEDWLYLP